MEHPMSTCTRGPMTGGREAVPPEQTAMLSVGDVAGMLRCSSRTVYRLSDAGKLPRPVKLGALVRWSRAAIEQWLADGCPPCRKISSR